MKIRLVLALSALWAGSGFVFAQDGAADRPTFEGLITVHPPSLGRDVKIYAKYFAARPSAENPEPVLFVNMNGMTYSTESWADLVPHERSAGDGVLLFDFMGQGRTLEANDPADEFPYLAQTEIVDLLLRDGNALGIAKAQRKLLVGVSYGSAISLDYMARFAGSEVEAIAAAPYVRPIAQMDDKIRMQIAWMDLNPLFEQVSFDKKYSWLLWQDIMSYPVLEPILTKNLSRMDVTYRAVHALIYGMHTFRADSLLAQLPMARIHGMIAGEDQYINEDVQRFYRETVGAARLGSLLVIPPAEHKISEAAPLTVAHWIQLIARRDPRVVNSGRVYEAHPEQGFLQTADDLDPLITIPAPQETVRSQGRVWLHNFYQAVFSNWSSVCQRFLAKSF